MMKTIFEKSNGTDGISVGECELKGVIPADLLREGIIGLPQLSELDVMRHYKELSEKLTIEYNKARQAAITQEITEVVAGSTSK